VSSFSVIIFTVNAGNLHCCFSYLLICGQRQGKAGELQNSRELANMPGLRTYLPKLADYTGAGVDTLNEWLRMLVSGGVFPVRAGRGPGSGVELSPKTLSVLILALLGSKDRRDVAEATRLLLKSKPARNRWCPITGATSLRDAIVIGLEGRGVHEGKPVKLYQIQVWRGSGTAILYWSGDAKLFGEFKIVPISFSATRDLQAIGKQFSVGATLHDQAIAKIVEDLKAYNVGAGAEGPN
jgi:hypothetical protein